MYMLEGKIVGAPGLGWREKRSTCSHGIRKHSQSHLELEAVEAVVRSGNVLLRDFDGNGVASHSANAVANVTDSCLFDLALP